MREDFLKKFLYIYWLRPETAILNSLLAKNLPIDYLKGISADISCGDGLFSFIANNGEIDTKFDIFKTTLIKSSIIKSEDIYNTEAKDYNPLIIKTTSKKYDYGIDINPTMLYKANKLNIYSNLYKYIAKDSFSLSRNDSLINYETNNQLLFKEQMFDTISIFSSTYMYKDLNFFFNTLNFILKDSGNVLLNIKTDSFKKFYKSLEQTYPIRFSSYIERNMRNIFPNLLDENSWESIIKQNNFIIEERIPTFSNALVPIWSIGLRFLTPLLVKMSNNITDKDSWFEIKNEFVDTFYKVLIDFYEEDINPKSASSFLYVLKKKD